MDDANDLIFPRLERRSFLKTSGHLLLGFSLLQLPFGTSPTIAAGSKPAGENTLSGISTNPKLIDSWIRLDTNGNVTVLTGKMELGQGIRTALMQIAAEELDVDMKRVRIITADTGQTPNERYTAGSASIESSGRSIRSAAAEARRLLLDLAGKKLQVPVSDLIIENGVIKVIGTKQIVSYGELLHGQRLEGEVTGEAPLKDPSKFKLVGTAQRREDIVAMVTGIASYVQDIRLPGMVHVRVIRPPVYRAKLLSLPVDQAQKMPGVLKIIRNGSFLAVVTQEEFQAVRALKAISEVAVWETKPISPSLTELYADMLKSDSKGELVNGSPVLETNFSSASIQHEAVYTRPYHMHGSIGPSCAIALWKEDLLTIWSHTQGVYPLRESVSNLLNMPEEKIRVIGVPGSGCYGHNGADDVAADAALVAIEMPGRPVRVQWMREDEHRWEPYGSAMMIKIRAAIDAVGRVTAWKSDLWSDTHSTRPGGRAGHLIAARDLERPFAFSAAGFSGGSTRNAVPLYDFAAKHVELHNYKGPLRTSALRSLGAYANIFALESFIDELANKAGKDPLQFRLSHLTDDRAKEVISVLAKRVEWNTHKLVPGSGLGFAFARYKNEAAYFAVAAEVKMDIVAKKFRVVKLTGCIDAGQTINSDGIKNQTSGGMIQAASWTLFEEVQYDAQGIRSTGWDTYPIMRFADVPDTEVIIVDRPQQAPLGAGEAAQGPTAAAIANAIFHATGSRLRELPLTPDKINWKKLMQTTGKNR